MGHLSKIKSYKEEIANEGLVSVRKDFCSDHKHMEVVWLLCASQVERQTSEIKGDYYHMLETVILSTIPMSDPPKMTKQRVIDIMIELALSNCKKNSNGLMSSHIFSTYFINKNNKMPAKVFNCQF